MTYDTTAPTADGPTTEGRVANFFGLRGDTWMRHANPRSVWSRFTCVPLIVIAVWSRAWIGWYCLIPIGVAIAWTWWNPRFFGVPASTTNWASKSVFGERIWTERRNTQIPRQFTSRVPNMANAYSCVGLAVLVYGLVAFDVWLTLAGIVIVLGGKLWYLDRMVLLFEDQKQRDAEIAGWEYGPSR